MATISNGNNGKIYEVLKQAGNNYLLRDMETGSVVIALGFRDTENGWDQGRYFGAGEEARGNAEVAFIAYERPDAYGYH